MSIGNPDLDWSTGAPTSRQFDDIYAAREGGFAESRTVFLEGCGLPARFAGREVFVVGELGFGTGANILVLWDVWRRVRKPHQLLHVISVEGFPLSHADVERAHRIHQDLWDLAARLRDQWPPQADGWHRMRFDSDNLIVDIAHMPVEAALAQWPAAVDAWFLDGFAPAKNPDMWSDVVFAHLARLSQPGAQLGTFTVAGAVRRGLEAVGFTVEKRPGHGRKRERLAAQFPGVPPACDRAPKTVAVLGAGIAGATVVHHLRQYGIKPIWFDPLGKAGAASGNPVGLVSPRLDRGTSPLAQFFAQSFRAATRFYEQHCPDAIRQRGLVHLAASAKDMERFQALQDHHRYTVDETSVLSAADLRAGYDIDNPFGALHLLTALALDPRAAIEAITADVMVRKVTAEPIRTDGSWVVNGTHVDAVVVTTGHCLGALLPGVDIIPTRGQISIARGVLAMPLSWGGYAIPMGDDVVFGASHLPGDARDDLRVADDAHNRALLEAVGLSVGETHSSRAGVRGATRTRLPVLGHWGDGMWGLGGLGSRGLCYAPILAEHLVAMMVGVPGPLSACVAAALCHSDTRP